VDDVAVVEDDPEADDRLCFGAPVLMAVADADADVDAEEVDTVDEDAEGVASVAAADVVTAVLDWDNVL